MSLGTRLMGLALGGLLVGAAWAPVARAQAPSSAGGTFITATSAADLRAWDDRITQLSRSGDLQRRRLDVDPLMPGRTHERFDQYYKGVPVYGGDVARQIENGLTVSIFGAFHEALDLDVTPRLSIAAATARVADVSGVTLGPGKAPRLVIYPHDGIYSLAYRARAFTAARGTEYFIDANSGEILARLDAVQRQAAVGRGTGVLGDDKKMSVSRTSGSFRADDQLRPPVLLTFDMRGNLNRTLAIFNGLANPSVSDIGVDSDNDWTDGALVDAHAHAGYVYDYYFKRFGRRGLDNNNLELWSFVHPADRNTILQQPPDIQNEFFLNAGYYGSGVMLYGDGLPASLTLGGQAWNYLAGGLDIVGHELTHGVTEYTSNLIYAGESGALNESFSDMMGTAVEFFFQAAGSAAGQADYLSGEDVITPGGLRSLSNPAAYGDPDHYSRRAILPNDEDHDNGGVHTNSGIGNHAYYLAIEGGTNRTSGLAVQGVGRDNRDQIEKVMYRAFTLLMPSNATYAVARAATIQAARELFGANSNAERAITQAWNAVGVN